ncbi:glycosyltransferase involved in cell wall biosynthesis [Mumia flava]|uniref:Glycosyltransferase involved in cell wall biosynthesis n=1 Tax=Mumia flava TaxID=1348852 RepID=A0A0B2B688_9ACTN|nr:glycosyltransferase [Mumia flava]PJJ56863.1 glycosyltransferase involved in cell wall biosynthesis [Mumia flava]
MRVVVVHGRYRSAAPSGENVVVDQESAALAEAGHEVVLFQRESDEIAGWSLARKAMLPYRSVWNRPVRDDLGRLLARVRPDVVHVHNTFPLLSPSVLHACADAGVPVVATLHNYKLLCASGDFFRDGAVCHACADGSVLPGLRHGCYRGSRIATAPVSLSLTAHRTAWRELVSAYVFISTAQRDAMRALDLPAERVFVKHNHVPEPPVAPAGEGDRDRTVAFVGRLDAVKGVPFLMRAWDAFRAARPDSGLRLVVVGGGPLEDTVRTWARGHGSVDVLGLLARPEAMRRLGRSLAAVVPSQWEETFGLVAVEAMAAGVAPLTPDRGSFPELVDDGRTGALYPAESVAGLARLLADVDDDPARFAGYGRAARGAYEKRFAPEAGLRALLDVYDFARSNRAVRAGSRR